MDEEKKKALDEQEKSPEKEQEKQSPPEEKQEEKQSEEQKQEPKEKTEEKQEENPPPKETPKEHELTVPDPKDEEILRLKTQLNAVQLGILHDCLEDATAIAESYVKSGKCKDINSALNEVVKKYPNMKNDSKDAKKGGFKVGADSDKQNKTDENRLANAFGIRKKGKV